MKLEKKVFIGDINETYRLASGNHLTNCCTFEILSNDFGDKDLATLHMLKSLGGKVKLTLEVEEPILDEVERKYLSGVIRPFRDRVKYISKCGGGLYQDEFIQIGIKNEGTISLPFFKTGTMYKKLEQNEEYKLDDLGL